MKAYKISIAVQPDSNSQFLFKGVNKYFHMVCIWEKFRTAVHKEVSLKTIWDHLESMYDLMALVLIIVSDN